MKTLNLKEMSTEELRELLTAIQEELKSRTQAHVVYTHNCARKAEYHLRKYRHWAKLVQAIDPTQPNGYAFVGQFLPIESESLVPENSIVVEACGDEITAYRITQSGKIEVGRGKKGFLSELIMKVQKEMEEKK